MNTIVLRNRHQGSPVDLARDNVIGAAIAHLPDIFRWVMILGGRNGLSTREIATLAGVSPRLIESTQNRGLTLIQKELLKYTRATS